MFGYRAALFYKTFYVHRSFFLCAGLVKWSFSGSKAAHALDGGTTSSGSITTMKNFICQLATEPYACFANGDVDVFADNTQRTGKTSRVKENGTATLSVATNVVFIQSNPPTEFQSISRLCPSILEKPCNKGTDHQISNLEETIYGGIFRPYRQKCLEELISTARSQLKVEGESNYVDFITKSIGDMLNFPGQKFLISIIQDLFICEKLMKRAVSHLNKSWVKLQGREQEFNWITSANVYQIHHKFLLKFVKFQYPILNF